jgi:phosphatidylserine decarboxylase
VSAALAHQYIDRTSGALRTEKLYRDGLVRFLYGPVREHMPSLFQLLVSAHHTRLLGYLNYDAAWTAPAWRHFAREQGIDLTECVDDPRTFRTARAVFERRIRYWETRPMPDRPDAVVAPADARVLVGAGAQDDLLRLKEKFFSIAELLGGSRRLEREFAAAAFAIFRLTPDKYHYNHSPVSGVVTEHFRVHGDYHSCNPSTVVAVATPHAKNDRVVTIIDTDVSGGSRVGKVAMIEIVALMIGEIVQCFSSKGYDDPLPVVPGLFLKRGAPKSLFRPGSSTTVLLFDPERIAFADDLLANQCRHDASSRYSLGIGSPAIETDIRVRSLLATARSPDHP